MIEKDTTHMSSAGRVKNVAIAAAVLFLAATSAWARTAVRPVTIVAAENFYGDIAGQIGGPDVVVISIMSNPDQDPHLFEISPAVGRNVSNGQIVIFNGMGYDPWMKKLLDATHSTHRRTIIVADLVGKKPGDNPHIWYDPQTMLKLAGVLSQALIADDPANKAGYNRRLAGFEASLKPLQTKIDELRLRLTGTPVTATEPVFGYMFDTLGMQVRNRAFQLAMMNNTEPSASDIAAFERDLRMGRVRLLVCNSQATSPTTDRLKTIAKASRIPVIGATETEPPGMTYQGWMMSELEAIDQALPGKAR